MFKVMYAKYMQKIALWCVYMCLFCCPIGIMLEESFCYSKLAGTGKVHIRFFLRVLYLLFPNGEITQ